MRNWITPTPVEEAARAALQEAGENRRQRALGWLLPLPSALLLALAALSICREAWALHWLYTPLMAAFVLLLAQVVRTVGDAPLWLLALGAVGVRVMFALGWTVYPHGDALTGWNLALELAAVPLGNWSSLTAAMGADIPLELPFVLCEALLLRLFGPSLAAVQLPGALWGGLSCVLTALLTRKLTGSRPAGLLAGALLACCPTLLFSVGALSVQPLYTLLILIGLYLLVCRPMGISICNEALAGLAWGIGQVLRPGLPVPLLSIGLWLLPTQLGRFRAEKLWLRTASLLGAFLAIFLLLGTAVQTLSGADVLGGSLSARFAIGLNQESAGQLTEEDRSLLTGEQSPEEAVAQRRANLRESLALALRKLRVQFASYNYPAPRMARGASLRSFLQNQAMHPLLQGYMLALLMLALAGTVSLRRSRAGLLPAALLLGYAAAAVVLEVDPVYNGVVIPLFALWAAEPALKLTAGAALLAGKKEGAPLPPGLAAVRLAVTVAVYALMLGLVLMFFSGEGAFIYEAF